MWRKSLLLVLIITTTFGAWRKYIGLVIGEFMNEVTLPGLQLALRASFPEKTSSLRLRISSLAQGWRMGLLRSATAWVGCFPVTRKSSLEMCGCAGSDTTGPGPLAGGMKSREYEYHPTLGLGAKSGGVL